MSDDFKNLQYLVGNNNVQISGENNSVSATLGIPIDEYNNLRDELMRLKKPVNEFLKKFENNDNNSKDLEQKLIDIAKMYEEDVSRFHIDLKKVSEVEKKAEEALTNIYLGNETETYRKVLLEIIKQNDLKKRPNSIIRKAEHVVVNIKDISNKSDRVFSSEMIHRMAVHSDESGDYESALNGYKASLHLLEEEEDVSPLSLANIQTNLGRLNFFLDKLVDSEFYFKSALIIRVMLLPSHHYRVRESRDELFFALEDQWKTVEADNLLDDRRKWSW